MNPYFIPAETVLIECGWVGRITTFIINASLHFCFIMMIKKYHEKKLIKIPKKIKFSNIEFIFI